MSNTNNLPATWSGIGFFAMRALLAWEFFESGMEKFRGQNWFTDIQDQFPFPVSLFSPDVNWYLSMSAELALPFFLLFGLFTRFSALVLSSVLLVAWYSIHTASGYNVCDNGYKLVLIYLVMLLPLLVQGAGTLSLDALLRQKLSHLRWVKFL